MAADSSMRTEGVPSQRRRAAAAPQRVRSSAGHSREGCHQLPSPLLHTGISSSSSSRQGLMSVLYGSPQLLLGRCLRQSYSQGSPSC